MHGLSPRVLPAVLASVGFLATLTVRSWQGDLRHRGAAAAGATASISPRSAAARGTPAPARLRQAPLLASIGLPQEGARPDDASRPATEPAIVLTGAVDFLDERAREETHSSRMR